MGILVNCDILSLSLSHSNELPAGDVGLLNKVEPENAPGVSGRRVKRQHSLLKKIALHCPGDSTLNRNHPSQSHTAGKSSFTSSCRRQSKIPFVSADRCHLFRLPALAEEGAGKCAAAPFSDFWLLGAVTPCRPAVPRLPGPWPVGASIDVR
jgi:hypothetical protein